jgi:Na+/melibiose symporter-like transporter
VRLALLILASAMPRDVLGLDPYQRSAISCARVGCAASVLGLVGAAGLYLYALFVPEPGNSFQMLAGILAIGSIVVLIVARARLTKESLEWKDLC